MNCYNCGCRLSEEDFCTNCGADVALYKKIMRTANSFYNEGLEKAGVRDLTGAINSLRQCLKFNKNHVEARNLLGLVYFECGEVVAALSEWVISKNLRPKKNIADDYIGMIQDNPARLDTMNQTIKKYNQALLYCTQDSKDLAMIQLKSVLSLNPKFIRAHHLLALLYIDAEDWQKAERELRKCDQIDKGNTTTRRYLREVEAMLHPVETQGQKDNAAPKKKKKEEEIFRYQSGNETIIQPIDVHEPKGVSMSSMVYVVIGLLIGMAITFFLILPARIQAAKAEVNDQLKTVSEQLSTKSADMEEQSQQLKELQKNNDDLQAQVDEYSGSDGTLQTMGDLLNAVNAYLTNPSDTATVATAIEKIQGETKIDQMSTEFQNVYNTLLSIVGPSVAQQYYQTGLSSYKAEDYGTAITNLQKALIYDPNNIDIIYNLANAYYGNGDNTNAATYYSQVVTQFGGTERARKSKAILDELGVTVSSSASSSKTTENTTGSTTTNNTTGNTTTDNATGNTTGNTTTDNTTGNTTTNSNTAGNGE